MSLITNKKINEYWSSLDLPTKVEKIRKTGYSIAGGLSITYQIKCDCFLLDNPHLKGETIEKEKE